MMDFDTFLDATRTTVFPGTKPSFISVAAFFVICFLVSNYHSYKEKTIKLLPYHSFYAGHITLRRIERSSSGPPQKNSKPQGSPI